MVGEKQNLAGSNSLNMKKIRIIFISILAIMFITFLVHDAWLQKKLKKEFIDLTYTGIIYEIRYIEGNRGYPRVRIGNQWNNINILESKIVNYIQTGDSILKETGTETIIVYRKNENDEWIEKVFD
jgi:hypothetical protein